MDCTQAKQKFQEFVDGTLSARYMGEIKAHLQSCASCNKIVEEFEAVVNVLSGLPHYQPMPQFSAKVLAAIELNEKRETISTWRCKLGYIFAFSALAELFLVNMAHGLGRTIQL